RRRRRNRGLGPPRRLPRRPRRPHPPRARRPRRHHRRKRGSRLRRAPPRARPPAAERTHIITPTRATARVGVRRGLVAFGGTRGASAAAGKAGAANLSRAAKPNARPTRRAAWGSAVFSTRDTPRAYWVWRAGFAGGARRSREPPSVPSLASHPGP